MDFQRAIFQGLSKIQRQQKHIYDFYTRFLKEYFPIFSQHSRYLKNIFSKGSSIFGLDFLDFWIFFRDIFLQNSEQESYVFKNIYFKGFQGNNNGYFLGILRQKT